VDFSEFVSCPTHITIFITLYKLTPAPPPPLLHIFFMLKVSPPFGFASCMFVNCLLVIVDLFLFCPIYQILASFQTNAVTKKPVTAKEPYNFSCYLFLLYTIIVVLKILLMLHMIVYLVFEQKSFLHMSKFLKG